MDFLALEECTEVLHTHFESVGAPKDRSVAKAISHNLLFPPGNIVYHQRLCFKVVSFFVSVNSKILLSTKRSFKFIKVVI